MEHETSLVSRRFPGVEEGQRCGQSLDWAGWGMVQSRGSLDKDLEEKEKDRQIWSVVFEGGGPGEDGAGLDSRRASQVTLRGSSLS